MTGNGLKKSGKFTGS